MVHTITTSTANSRSYSWTVQAGLPDGTNYRIKISDVANNDVHDYSDYFEIKSPSAVKTITVTSPTSSSVWVKGNPYQITWMSTGTIASVRIDVYSSTTLVHTISTSTENDGAHYWTAQSGLPDGTNYRVRISDVTDGGVNDYSDYFEIASQYSGSISITNPISTTTWVMGTYATITWSSTGNLPTVRIELYKENTLWHTIASQTVNDGDWGWTVPTSFTAGAQYRVYIFCVENPDVDVMSSYFSITT